MGFINGKNILIIVISLLSIISLIAGIVTVSAKGVYYYLNPEVYNCTDDIKDCKEKMQVAQSAGRNWIGAWFIVTAILLVAVVILTGFVTTSNDKFDELYDLNQQLETQVATTTQQTQ